RIAPADAEDVFQAVFLTLARQARRLRSAETLPAWLHAVARRLALNAVRARRRRATAESKTPSRASRDPLDEVSAREFLAALDAAVARLPKAEQSALILCCLN